jgi:hypothetical protein
MSTLRQITIEEIARLALMRDEDRHLRGRVMAFLRQNHNLSAVRRPDTKDKTVLAVAASLLEMFAERGRQAPPRWTAEIGALPNPVYLVHEVLGPATAAAMRRLATEKSPKPFKSRNILAPPKFLTFV